jgi:hypothetical protein
MKYLLKKSALAAAVLLSLGTAQAAIITFDDPVTSPFAPSAPLFGHEDEFYQGGFFIDTYSNSASAQPGDLVAALKDTTDSAGLCSSGALVCPTVGATGNYLTVLNDGFLAIGAKNGSLISLSAFSAGFVGVAGDTYSTTRAGRVIIIGVRADNSATSIAGSLALPDGSGAFSFSNFTVPASFAAEKFAFLQIYGAYCPAGTTTCSSFTTDKAQFALDNLNITAVPEPGTWGLMGLGLAGIAAIARRRRAV